MAKTLSESAAADIRKTIDGVTSDPNRIPGCVMVVVGKDGKPIFQHASGTRGVETKDPMTLDTIFSIFSCTKMIGGVAAMQLVEQGKLSLDDADMLEKILPELKDMKILKSVDENGKAELVEKKNRITLRMLLSHTCLSSAPYHGVSCADLFNSWVRVWFCVQIKLLFYCGSNKMI